MYQPERARVLLISPQNRILLFKYRNTGRSGAERRCWTTVGGGCDPGETVRQTALREIGEETGIVGVQLGPIVWYGEDSDRSGDWGVTFREHFIVAHAPTETLDVSGWTDHERAQILETRWWTLDEIRASDERIYPHALADHLAPILAGDYPAELLILPPLSPSV